MQSDISWVVLEYNPQSFSRLWPEFLIPADQGIAEPMCVILYFRALDCMYHFRDHFPVLERSARKCLIILTEQAFALRSVSSGILAVVLTTPVSTHVTYFNRLLARGKKCV